ncbi:MAG TPA: PEP-CTERM sorting domain-containing protein [Oscillatoriaceae cyanobacterium M33_DOE_052]|uniref:PEP-CTERM sorting domain-containing protein n=1 Tax=Planktothricoides sp. SpSt-374 TaxID=2282167 RepID=A0A7C3VPY6_9CYAN|nr:PEP-CTERM sorting domain-containing protein [Oscillatoriaceae cyanobacterium M33_DOE_052]
MNFSKYFLPAAATAISGILCVVPNAEAFSFGNSSIVFDQNTTVDFGFVVSNGKFMSQFGVAEINNGQISQRHAIFGENAPGYDTPLVGDYQGTVGTTVTQPKGTFTFLAGVEYSLYLDSILLKPDGTPWNPKPATVLSNSELNRTLGLRDAKPDGSRAYGYNTTGGKVDQVLFSGDLFDSGVLMRWEDHGAGGHIDYNDFYVTAEARPIPEPATLVGLGLVGGAMAVTRRRKRSEIS